MTFVRATDRQIQTIRNLCFNRHNIEYVLKTLDALDKDSLFYLSVVEAKDLISELLERSRKCNRSFMVLVPQKDGQKTR